jgi:hypothetical protein
MSADGMPSKQQYNISKSCPDGEYRGVLDLMQITEILADHGMHAPECPRRIRDKRQASLGMGAYIIPQPCDCFVKDYTDA